MTLSPFTQYALLAFLALLLLRFLVALAYGVVAASVLLAVRLAEYHQRKGTTSRTDG